MTKRDVRGYQQVHIDKADYLMGLAQKTKDPEAAIKLYRQARGNYSAAGERVGVELSTKRILDAKKTLYMSQADKQMETANMIGENPKAIPYLRDAAALYRKAERTEHAKSAAAEIKRITLSQQKTPRTSRAVLETTG